MTSSLSQSPTCLSITALLAGEAGYGAKDTSLTPGQREISTSAA